MSNGDPLAAAKALPEPTPGLKLERVPLDVMMEYLNLHHYEIAYTIGGTAKIRPIQGDTMVHVAKQLAQIGD